MTSLPWILALTLTFLHCLSAVPTMDPRKIQKWTMQTLLQIEKLNNISCPMADSTFYITSDVSVDHVEQMLQCAKDELEVVANECFGNTSVFWEYYSACYRTSATIQEILKNTGGQIQNKPTYLPCEGSHKPYTEFLNDLKILIQKLNNKV